MHISAPLTGLFINKQEHCATTGNSGIFRRAEKAAPELDIVKPGARKFSLWDAELINSNQSSDRTAILLDALWRAGDILSAAGIKEYVILADESVREFGRDVNELRRLRATADERFLSAPRGQADKNLPKRTRSFPFRALPELEALLTLRRTQTDAEHRRGERIIPYVFHDATGRALPASKEKLSARLGAAPVLRPGYRTAFRTTSVARLCAISNVWQFLAP